MTDYADWQDWMDAALFNAMVTLRAREWLESESARAALIGRLTRIAEIAAQIDTYAPIMGKR